MTWTENTSRYWVEEFVAKVGKPAVYPCPTRGCGHKAKPHCEEKRQKECLWFVCEVCEHTTSVQPKYDFGPFGKKVVRWSVRASHRLPRLK
jgi:hypothetical protein